MTDSRRRTVPPEEKAKREEQAEREPPSADRTGHASFPASDPPAVWTWEVKRAQEEDDGE
jgi:hypothetical protein